ncbi:MAG TPA: MOSC domain-containing protein [Miltoncostaea sp.]|nr:MOSC domain-containing protein [Miltoncostaea sp.]
MRVTSVNVGMPAPLPRGVGAVLSGIVKTPVAGRVHVGRVNVEGDGQADLRVHGGPDKAVYAYPAQHYGAWARELGRDDLVPGFFGENLTLEGADEEDVLVGDRFRIGTALLEVSQPRIPCFKLGLRVGDPRFLRPFLESGRSGFYLRVVEEGDLAAGDAVERVSRGEGGLSVADVCRLFARGEDPDAFSAAAAVPALEDGWKVWMLERADALTRRAR